MSKKQQVPSRQYTDEFKVEAVRLAESIGAHQAAKRLGIPDSSMWNWLRLHRAGKLKAMRLASGQTTPGVRDLEVENERLRRELANTKMDLEIVKKAAVFFAKGSR
jgi:transposase